MLTRGAEEHEHPGKTILDHRHRFATGGTGKAVWLRRGTHSSPWSAGRVALGDPLRRRRVKCVDELARGHAFRVYMAGCGKSIERSNNVLARTSVKVSGDRELDLLHCPSSARSRRPGPTIGEQTVRRRCSERFLRPDGSLLRPPPSALRRRLTFLQGSVPGRLPDGVQAFP